MRDNNNYQTVKENNLYIFTKAKALVDYSLNITDNYNKFPKKVRFSFTNRIQDHAININLYIHQAFAFDEDNPDINLLKQAVLECKGLSFMIELSYRRHYITSKNCAFWSKIVKELEDFIMSFIL